MVKTIGKEIIIATLLFAIWIGLLRYFFVDLLAIPIPDGSFLKDLFVRDLSLVIYPPLILYVICLSIRWFIRKYRKN
ncbi:MAG: hypothetical protein ISS34_05800 [Candidatus Omnitrophica bacterium]|nr:hypothetical protein [Candidatus Omnitrophota bacterium]